MTDRLKIAIEELYEIFAKYQGLSKLEGSPLYDDLENWKKQLKSKKLRELTNEDLSLFAGKVILTWGNENDYKFYLPRIFELTAELKSPYDIWTLYSRLECANLKAWDFEEQTAINNFTLELWRHMLNDNSDNAEREFKDYFHAISFFYPDFSEILNAWESNESFASIKHLINYIFEERQNIFDKGFFDSIEKNTKNIEQFKTWLTSENILKKIEKVFYDYEKQEIADRLSLVEQLLTHEKKYSK